MVRCFKGVWIYKRFHTDMVLAQALAPISGLRTFVLSGRSALIQTGLS